jgi:glycosyltransferase involved in cell wall biosynthesis
MRARMEPQLSILMPVYNEAATVERAVEAVLAAELPVSSEIVLVDDGSTDGTREVIERASWPADRVRIHSHDGNRGKGAAVRTALAEARGEFATIFDADLEYDAEDLTILLPPLLDGTASAVFGVRAFDGFTSHSYLFVLGNRAVTLTANVLFNVYVKDLMTMHKAVRTDVLKQLPLRENGFAIEAEITARLLQHGVRIFEVPVHYKARATNEGKKLTWVDGLRVVRTLVRCRFTRG